MDRASGSSSESKGFSPWKVFAVLVVAVGGLVAWGLAAAGDDGTNDVALPRSTEPAPSPSPTDDLTLTDEEAIAIFRKLNRAATKAVQQRDLAAALAASTNHGPLADNARKTIKELRSDNVDDRIRYESLRLEVMGVSPSSIRLKEVRNVYPCFVDGTGRDVTKDPTVVRQWINWTLRPERSAWQLHRGLLIKDRPQDRESRCR